MDRTPVHAFAPGEYLRDELEERGWNVEEFSERIGRPVQAVSEILDAKQEITDETARAISGALGTSPEVWLNLQKRYCLHQQLTATQPALAVEDRRARLRNKIPLAEARSRGWIPDTSDLDAQEAAVCELLEISTLEESPHFAMAARRSNSDDPITAQQTAWLGHVRRSAEAQEVADFNVEALRLLAGRLPWRLREGPDALAGLPGFFSECGVCLVFCEGLQGGKLDGAVTFLADGRPVIGLTARGDRFDILLFTLLHECAHLVLGHISPQSGAIVEHDLAGTQTDPQELAANDQASDWLFPDGFRGGSWSKPEIDEAADRHGVHWSVVIGRIQHTTQKWNLHRSEIPKVRPALENAGLLS